MFYDKDFFANRLVELRLQLKKGNKDVSAQDMSLPIGQSKNYINKIEGQKAYPSMDMFFNICEYLGITPIEFFDVDIKNPTLLNELIAELQGMDNETLDCFLLLAKKLRSKK